jgi:hypothetical protein
MGGGLLHRDPVEIPQAVEDVPAEGRTEPIGDTPSVQHVVDVRRLEPEGARQRESRIKIGCGHADPGGLGGQTTFGRSNVRSSAKEINAQPRARHTRPPVRGR